MLAKSDVLINRNRPFLLLLIGQNLSQYGNAIYTTVLVVFIYQITKSSLAVGAILSATTLATLMFGFLAGVIVDRMPLRTTLALASVVSAVTAAGMMAVTQVWQIYFITFILAASGRLFSVAWSSLIPVVVNQEQLVPANAILSSAKRISIILGPLIGGALVAANFTKVAFALNAASFLVVGLIVLAIAPAGVSGTAKKTPLVQQFREGWRFIGENAFLRSALYVITASGFAVGANNTLIVAYADQQLSTPPSAFGGLVSALGGGMLLGAALTPAIQKRYGRNTALVGGLVAFGLSLVLLGISHRFDLALAFRALMGAGYAVFNTSVWAALQQHVPAEVRGRTFGAMRTSEDVTVLAAMAATGFFADTLGVAYSLSLCGLLALSGLFGFARALRVLPIAEKP